MTTTAKDLDLARAARDYERVERAILHLERHAREQPGLAELAAAAGLSEYHFHRLFSRWAGTTPKRFLQVLTAEHAREALESSRSLLEAAWEAGLSGPGRLHDLMVQLEAVTPGELKTGGAGLGVEWGVHPSPFGRCLLAATSRGICALEFLAGREPDEALDDLAERWPGARLRSAPRSTRALLERVFPAPTVRRGEPLHLLVKGTNFQLQVWRALLRIPPGAVTSYGEIARVLDHPRAARAVGQAVGANPVSWLIPCHRVIRSLADLGGYRWGTQRKKAMLAWEAARGDEPPAAAG